MGRRKLYQSCSAIEEEDLEGQVFSVFTAVQYKSPNRTNSCIAKLDKLVMATAVSDVQVTPHLLHYLKMEATCFSEIFATTYCAVQCHSPKNSNILL